MRTKIIIGLGVLAVAAVAAVVRLMPVKLRAGPWKLSDGSRISLAGVTYGTKHRMRYGNSLVDYLDSFLTPAMRTKWKPKVAIAGVAQSNSVVVWFWIKDAPNLYAGSRAMTGPGGSVFTTGHDRFWVVTVDENGMESSTLKPLPWGWWQGSNLLQSVELREFPRRSKEIKVQIYDDYRRKRLGEFVIPNRVSRDYPVWAATPLPATVDTNEVRVRLTSFEVDKSYEDKTWWGDRNLPQMSTQATMNLSMSPKAADGWCVRSVEAVSATGEHHWSTIGNRFRIPGQAEDKLPQVYKAPYEIELPVKFPGTCWLEEAAWKLRVELQHTTNFPAEEVWVVKGLLRPARGQGDAQVSKTNIYGDEIEFSGLSDGQTGNTMMNASGHGGYPHRFAVSSSPSVGKSLKAVEIRDDQGRQVDFVYGGRMPSRQNSVGRRAKWDETFYLKMADDAQTVDVTLAYTKSQFVELMAKPTKAAANEKKSGASSQTQ